MIAALALMLAQPVAAALPDIEVGRADWGTFERVRPRVQLPTPRIIAKVEEIMRMRQCELPGQRTRRFDITVNYAIRFDQQRQVDRIVVEDIGCPLIETLVGNAVTELLRNDLMTLPATRDERWYTGDLNFTLSA